MAEKIINSERISQVEFIQGPGQYRAIVKVQAGFMTVVNDIGIENNWGKKQWNSAIDVFRGFKKGALQSIEFQPEGQPYFLTVFARKAKKVVLMDTQLFRDMTVGDINGNWTNTNLYSQHNYQLVEAKTWADKAFVKNTK